MGLFGSSNKKSRPSSGKTIIAAGCSIRGEIGRLEGDVLVEGTFEGVIESEYDLAVGAQGKVKGLIKANHIVVTGVLEGKVVCDHLEILSGGKFIGELVAGDLSIEKGAKFIGKSHEVTESGAVMTFNEVEKRTIIQSPDAIAQIEIEQLVEAVVTAESSESETQNNN